MNVHFDLIQIQIVTYQIKLLWQKSYRLSVDWEEGNHAKLLQCYAEIKLLKEQLQALGLSPEAARSVSSRCYTEVFQELGGTYQFKG